MFGCRSHRKRVFETVKNVNQTVRQRSVTPTNSNIPGSNQSLSSRTSPLSSGLSSPHSSVYGGDLSGDGVALDNRVQSILMETASNQDRFGFDLSESSVSRVLRENSNTDVEFRSSSLEGREKKASGAEDLRLALRRLSLRRQNNLSERRFFEEERDRRQGGLGALPDSLDHQGLMTPSESIMSLGNIHVWASRGPYLPDKLQIVKPLEGEGDRKPGAGWRKRDVERCSGAGAKKASKRGWDAEGERRRENRHGRAPEGERETGWGLAVAGIERERGRKWARDRGGSRKVRGGRDRSERPLSLMLFNSFWSLMHHHKSGSFTSPHSYYRDTQPRGWL